MWDLVRSLSYRFYAALALAIVVMAGLGAWTWGLVAVGVGLLGIVVTLFVLIPLLFLLIGFFYRLFGYITPTPRWRDTKLTFPDPVDITISDTDESPLWANGGMDNSGSLRQFIAQHDSTTDDTELRIGIVLAGGGAKGVYQAGALRALWEFLKREDALTYVRAVTGTSIGSWNAMFWLTNQVEDNTQRDWWVSASPHKLVGPTFYRPIAHNYIIHNRPWREQFTTLFGDRSPQLLNGDHPYFYFTRTNVGKALLHLTTNHGAADQYYRFRDGRYDPAGPIVDTQAGRYRAASVSDIEQAVFASMDIPPAFRRMEVPEGQQCEDGGVIDNLPIRYTTRYEGCNLLFVFPLNATFEAEPSDRSMLRRMFRVMDIRQGVLEQGALRDIGLYNGLIKAHTSSSDFPANLHAKPVTTFCISPEPPLDVGTFEFWKTRRNGPTAYTLMYEATRRMLANFDFSITNHDVWMTTVGRKGGVRFRNFTL